MQTIEVSGKTVAEATDAAAKQLGATADSLKVTVLEEHKGLFGKAIVRIRAEVSATPVAVEAAAEPAAPEKPKRTTRKTTKAKAAEAEPAAVTALEEAPATAEGQQPGNGQAVLEASEEDGSRLLGLLNDVLSSGDLEVSAHVTEISGRYVNIELDGKDVAHLVGKHGEVLNALQYVLNIIANQQIGNGVRATLDGNHYRHRREEALTKLATQIAEQVQKRGEEAVLDALPAFERRIVHKALADFPGVSTYSEGEEPNRRVVIGPTE